MHPDDDGSALWDAEAAAFDEPADHGLRDPRVRESWRALLLGLLPPAPATVADLGCGTGTLSLLLAQDGFLVEAVDFSPRMVELARAKTAGVPGVRVRQADAADPPLEAGSCDVVLCRHVLWALPDPALVLERWIRLLTPGGRLVLVEGHWSNGAGLSAEQTVDLVAATGRTATVTRLTGAVYWGREISDERYVVTG